MKSKRSIVALAAFAVGCCASQAAIYTEMGPVVNPANGHSYYLISSGTWNETEAYAETLGGHLATINDAAENVWIFNNLIASDPNRNPWIGLTAPDYTGPWSWVSGEPVTYLPWAPGEPNGIGAPPYAVNIFQVNSPYPGQWNDAPLYDPYEGIVEVVPEPSSLSLLLAAGLGWAFYRSRRK